MEEIRKDSRFSHIASDPRFRPMPKSKRKVKIDHRFKSIFTNKDFIHRTDIDKRGRPTLLGSKKQKHVMERFYDLSESGQESGGEDHTEHGDEQPRSKTNSKQKKRKKNELDPVSSVSRKKLKTTSKDETGKENSEDDIKTDEDERETLSEPTKPGGKKKLHTGKDSSDELNDDDNDVDESDEEEEEDEDGEEIEIDQDIIEYTKDHELEETEVDHKWNELHTDAPIVTDSTRRLAVCNMDWDFVKAQDLYVLFKSFVPQGGQVKSVAIYPSEFGKERMAEEAQLGPRELRLQKQREEEEKLEGDEMHGTGSSAKKMKKKQSCGGDQQKAKRLDKEEKRGQAEKLREYQLNRLRYYYAVVDCDSVSTADNIYNECDGREYQLSSVRLDLRFIPEDMTFEDEPKEFFSEEEQGVTNYQPSEFNSSALSQAKVEVTWDETDFDRLSKRMSGLQQKELESIVEENKYADIIAPPESDSDMEDEDGRPEWLKTLLSDGEEEEKKEISENEKIRLYRKVLMDKVAEDEEEEKKEEGEVDMEVEWQPGLKSAAEKKLKKQEKNKEQSAIVGEYLEKKRQKKKKKRDEKLNKQKEENGDDQGDEENLAFSDDELPAGFDIEDMKEMMDGEEDLPLPSKIAKKKKNKKKMGKQIDDPSNEEEKMKAELELMLMDGEYKAQRKLAKPEVVKDLEGSKKKSKKKLAKEKKMAAEEKEDFVLDMEDPRFSALYSSHHFHIDPSAPQFKKTKNMLKLVDEQIKRKTKKEKSNSNSRNGVNNDSERTYTDQAGDQTAASKSMSQSLIESLRRKMKK